MSEVIRYNCETLFDGGIMNQAGDGDYVEYADYLSQLQQTDALQTSLNNIINAFGIKGEGAHSKLVIEYVSGLVAESEALKQAIPKPREIDFHDDRLDDVSVAEQVGFNHAISTIKKSMQSTPNTDAFTAELRAQGVGEFAADMWKRGNELVAEGAQKSLIVQVRLAAKLADTYVDNLRAGRKG